MDAAPDNGPLLPDTTSSLLRRVAFFLLVFLGLVATASVSWLLTVNGVRGVALILRLAGAVGIAWGSASILFWHRGLAAAVALAPLPGLALSVALIVPWNCVPWSYLLGLFIAQAMVDRFIAGVALGEPAWRATGNALRGEWPMAVAVLVLASIVPALNKLPGFAIGNLAAICSAALVSALAMVCLHSDESFIARTNRWRETLRWRIEALAPLSLPRWQWTMSGVWLVLTILAVFGLRLSFYDFVSRGGGSLVSAMLSGGLVAVAAAIATRTWRRSVALFLLTASAVATACFVSARTRSGGAYPEPWVGEFLCAAFVPLARLAASASRHARSGGHESAADDDALFEAGPVGTTMLVGGALVLAPWVAQAGMPWVGVWGGFTFAEAGLLVFLPALTGLTRILFPRRRTVAELYRLR